MKRLQMIHPALFAVFPILALYSYNKNLTSVESVVAPLMAVSGFTLLLWALLRFVLGERGKAALVVSFFLFLFFSYGHFAKAMGSFNFEVGGFVVGPDKVLFPTWIILMVLAGRFLIRTQKPLHGVFSIVGFSLVLIPLVNIGVYWYQMKIPLSASSHVDAVATLKNSAPRGNLPDIYYLIFDRYASQETLKKFYNFDNREFIDFLSQKGFIVTPKSRSNYLNTAHSLSSSLNMEYLDDLAKGVGVDSDYWGPIYDTLKNHKVGKLLKAKGYTYIHFGSSWEPTSQNKNADVNINLLTLNEFASVLYQSTMFYPIGARFPVIGSMLSGLNRRGAKRDRTLYKFAQLAKMPAFSDQPTFVFAHFLIPHPDYVFKSDGSILTEAEASARTPELNYLGQLRFANVKIKEVVNTILSLSEIPPVIIIQADEGPYPRRYREDDTRNWDDATLDELQIKTGILNAYYLPGVDKSGLHPSISPVNTFRLIFNLYFGANFELLPDRHYIYFNKRHPYKLTEVTDKLR